MSNKKVGITTAITAIIIMAFLIIYLAKPCDGDYKFSLKEMSFECSLATIDPDPTPGPNSGSGDITTTPDDSNNSDEMIHVCINNKIARLEAQTRQEVVNLGVAAGLGKYFACKTVTVNKEKSAQGPKSNEYISGSPECSLVSAEVEDRAKVIECGTKNGKPFIKVKVKGKGCEYSNKATFKIVANYKRNINQSTKKHIEAECKKIVSKSL